MAVDSCTKFVWEIGMGKSVAWSVKWVTGEIMLSFHPLPLSNLRMEKLRFLFQYQPVPVVVSAEHNPYIRSMVVFNIDKLEVCVRGPRLEGPLQFGQDDLLAPQLVGPRGQADQDQGELVQNILFELTCRSKSSFSTPSIQSHTWKITSGKSS